MLKNNTTKKIKLRHSLRVYDKIAKALAIVPSGSTVTITKKPDIGHNFYYILSNSNFPHNDEHCYIFRVLHSKEISIGIPRIVIYSLDQFIARGNRYDIKPSDFTLKNYPEASDLDISRSGLIRYLISAYGSRKSKLSSYVYDSLTMNDENSGSNKGYVSVRTRNPEVLKNPATRTVRLVNAMIDQEIPIEDLMREHHRVYYDPNPKVIKQIKSEEKNFDDSNNN